MSMARFVAALSLIVLVTGCGGGSGPLEPTPVQPPQSASTLTFTTPNLSGVSAGHANTGYSFCRPPITGNDLCGSSSTNPHGGTPPYTFELGAGGGFPPIGMHLNLNGTLTGIPTAAGVSNFTVCAIDLTRTSKCDTVEFTVDPAAPPPPPPPPPATASFYANWTCNNSAQCASVRGHVNGSAGPFCSVAACTAWNTTYGVGTCDAQALHPIYNFPPAGTCWK
jgi:putative Ig domain-containing protein